MAGSGKGAWFPLPLALLLAVLPSLSPIQAAAPLALSVSQVLSRPEFSAATWGVVIGDATTGATLFETNAHKLLKPASNAKLFTAALALDTFPPEHRLRTDLHPCGRITRDGTLHGDLVVYGRGDFSLAARFHGDTAHALDPLVDAIARSGVRRIRGTLVADDGFFIGPPFGNGWNWDDLQYYYGAEVSALSADDNTIDLTLRPGSTEGDPVTVECDPPCRLLRIHAETLRTGPSDATRELHVRRDPGSRDVMLAGVLPAGGAPSRDAVTIPEPALHFVQRLRERLASRHITVDHEPRREPGAASRLAGARGNPPGISVESAPISELVQRMLKPSQNLYAQLLLLQAGTPLPPQTPQETSESRGLRALRNFVDKAGIPPGEVLLDDGSGLSRSSLVTPAALVGLLRLMDRHPRRELFLDALPVAGSDGTLGGRLKQGPAAGNLRAKTGSLRYVSTLSGFVTNAAGGRLVFSLMLNAYNPAQGGPSGREALDEIAEILATSRP